MRLSIYFARKLSISYLRQSHVTSNHCRNHHFMKRLNRIIIECVWVHSSFLNGSVVGSSSYSSSFANHHHFVFYLLIPDKELVRSARNNYIIFRTRMLCVIIARLLLHFMSLPFRFFHWFSSGLFFLKKKTQKMSTKQIKMKKKEQPTKKSIKKYSSRSSHRECEGKNTNPKYENVCNS